MANRVMGYVICGYNSVDNLMSEQTSPFRRWTTGSGAGSSYRHHDHRNMFNKQISEGSAAVANVSNSNGTSASVSRWSLGLEHLLADPSGAAAFAHFLANEYAAENIRFWWACEKYKATEDGCKRAELAAQIWQTHLDEKASEPVNVDATARRAAAPMLCRDPPPPDLFLHAQKQIFNVMKFDSYPRFLRSGVHAECARADLLGLPPPYPPSPRPDTTKLKKSASNASERRRSGGASLLPWKMRNTSRDRLNEPAVTDVVKSQASALLCRVLLPDGATTVVELDPTLSVQHLVQKLLRRRNLLCDHYDVVYEPKQGESSTIDVQSPSTILSGRQVSVERRVLVRIEASGRCVAVRCRAARRLRHVLRPVATRYRLRGPLAVLKDGLVVHPDTIMQDLDGCRLQVVESSDSNSRMDPKDREPDSDADSLSDVALRLQDDRDLVSQATSTSSSRSSTITNTTSEQTPTTTGSEIPGVMGKITEIPGLCRVPEIPGNMGNIPEIPGNAARGPEVAGVSGRVRAALIFVPPVHHHPPDFLDNLRETQRQRLQSRDSPPRQAPPRTPPPLPPKPLRPPPTVV